MQMAINYLLRDFADDKRRCCFQQMSGQTSSVNEKVRDVSLTAVRRSFLMSIRRRVGQIKRRLKYARSVKLMRTSVNKHFCGSKPWPLTDDGIRHKTRCNGYE